MIKKYDDINKEDAERSQKKKKKKRKFFKYGLNDM